MFLINQVPSNQILTPIVLGMKDKTPNEIESFILTHYDEEWFLSTTPSLSGNDNRLNHRIRTIRAKNNITI